MLIELLGRAVGSRLYALSHNRDARPVEARRRRGSIGAQRALGRSGRNPDIVDAALIGLVDRVTRRMRAAGRVGRTVVLRLRFEDFARATRSHTLPRATADTDTVLLAAQWLLAGSMPLIQRRGITLVGVAVTNLENDGTLQLALPLRGRRDALDSAIDLVRERFGSQAVTRAVLLGRDRGIEVPRLPD